MGIYLIFMNRLDRADGSYQKELLERCTSEEFDKQFLLHRRKNGPDSKTRFLSFHFIESEEE